MTDRELPHWDMTLVYPGLESEEFESGFMAALQAVDDLAELFDVHGVDKQDAIEMGASTVEAFETIIRRYNEVLDTIQTTAAYIQSFITTDSRNAVAQAKWSIFQPKQAKLSLLGTRFSAWVGSMDVEELLERAESARAHAYFLEKAKTLAKHLMSPAEEELAAALGITGGSAWEKLYGNFSSQIVLEVELDGETQALPMSAVRNLAFDPDRAVRERAFEAELEAWEEKALPIAAALNSIKGLVVELGERRRWESALEESLFDYNIDRETLDAMMEAARESFPDFRRYLKAKARVLGLPALAWYDIFAPLGEHPKTWTYEEATTFIVDHFGSYSDRLKALAERAFTENWIDAEPRPGKRDGAFCMRLRKDESRILANFKPAFDGVSTLAHELGHAYHNQNLAKRTMLQRITPMTLAETASIFCQTIIRDAALEAASPEERLVILEGSLQDACQVVVDITSRMLFEQAVFEQRKERELSIDEFNEIMLKAQKETYAEALDPDRLHPYMWAAKPHYYSKGRSFYNYPYMFGLLFGLGLYAQYQDDPEGFKAGYDDLLSSTGLGGAAELAGRFGIDVRKGEFWRSSLAVVRSDIDQFEQLVDQVDG